MMKPIENRSNFYDDVLFSALANNTRIAYDKGWSCFQDYCVEAGVNPLSATPDQVADFLSTWGRASIHPTESSCQSTHLSCTGAR